MKLPIFCATLSVVAGAVARRIMIHNLCPYTVWPAIFTDNGDGPESGWEAQSMSAVERIVLDDWVGEVWGRLNCDFGRGEGPDQCATGACQGGLECKSYGTPPITRARIELRQWKGGNVVDIYYVSLTNGFNIPVRIAPSSEACGWAECAVDLTPGCPEPLRKSSNGTPLGCMSPCLGEPISEDNQLGDSPNCCTGVYSSPETCPLSGVQFYDYFKPDGCRSAQVFTFDRNYLWDCEDKHKSDYTITFCPFKRD